MSDKEHHIGTQRLLPTREWRVACPHCGAKAGRGCQTITGRKTKIHKMRAAVYAASDDSSFKLTEGEIEDHLDRLFAVDQRLKEEVRIMQKRLDFLRNNRSRVKGAAPFASHRDSLNPTPSPRLGQQREIADSMHRTFAPPTSTCPSPTMSTTSTRPSPT